MKIAMTMSAVISAVLWGSAGAMDIELADLLATASNCAYEIGSTRQGDGLCAVNDDRCKVKACLQKGHDKFRALPGDDWLYVWNTADAHRIDGYLLLATDDELILAIRGTQAPTRTVEGIKDIGNAAREWGSIAYDWFNDIFKVDDPLNDPDNEGYHKGFRSSWTRMGENLKTRIPHQMMQQLGNRKFYLAGHSKGGAVATIGDIDLSENHEAYGLPKGPDRVYEFEAARSITQGVLRSHNAALKNLTRFEYRKDTVPFLPPTYQEVKDIVGTDWVPFLLSKTGAVPYLQKHKPDREYTANIGQLVYVRDDGSLNENMSGQDVEARRMGMREQLRQNLTPGLLAIAAEHKLGQLKEILQDTGDKRCVAIFSGIDDHTLYWKYIRKYRDEARKRGGATTGIRIDLDEDALASCCKRDNIEQIKQCLLNREG